MAGKQQQTLKSRLRDITQEEAAERLSISRSYVSQVLSGDRLPSIDTVVEAADHWKVSDNELGRSVRAFKEDHDVKQAEKAAKAAAAQKRARR